ncbi:hypothetical protein Aph02nite_77210 [Actinoplanes philippinensis]|nr:hypothetical protein Aph02nite_77210 [Actinoplanes philippinensis]
MSDRPLLPGVATAVIARRAARSGAVHADHRPELPDGAPVAFGDAAVGAGACGRTVRSAPDDLGGALSSGAELRWTVGIAVAEVRSGPRRCGEDGRIAAPVRSSPGAVITGRRPAAPG